MEFGMIGAGRLSRAIAGHAIRAGHNVVFSNSSGPDTLTNLVDALGPRASAGTVTEAGAADFVVLAVRWSQSARRRAVCPTARGEYSSLPQTNGKRLPPISSSTNSRSEAVN
jgi:8-hydroxy-5-deazaflavin:NADPH oxidoreductase